jgi:hypothetical protein
MLRLLARCFARPPIGGGGVSFADRFMQTDFLQQIQGGQQIELIENAPAN